MKKKLTIIQDELKNCIGLEYHIAEGEKILISMESTDISITNVSLQDICDAYNLINRSYERPKEVSIRDWQPEVFVQDQPKTWLDKMGEAAIEEINDFLPGTSGVNYADSHIENKKPSYKQFKQSLTPQHKDVPTEGIVCDCGSVSGKNPGIFEYRGVDIATKKILFSVQIPGETTNNLAELLAAIHGLKELSFHPEYYLDNNSKYKVYSDSVTAIAWVRNRMCRSSFTIRDKEQQKMLDEAMAWLKEHAKTNLGIVHFWDNNKFGENFADYSRK